MDPLTGLLLILLVLLATGCFGPPNPPPDGANMMVFLPGIYLLLAAEQLCSVAGRLRQMIPGACQLLTGRR